MSMHRKIVIIIFKTITFGYMTKKIVIAIGGASGAIYASCLLKALLHYSSEEVQIHIVHSENAKINWELEIGTFDLSAFPFPVYKNNDFFAPFASGSALFDTMVIIPCSMGLIGRINAGISDDLITRAADVMLKERKKLILVPRETPYSLIHLKNMTAVTEAGGIICPASPSFYTGTQDVEGLVMTVVHRIIDLIGLPQKTFRWGTSS
jgi:4-hydroxy-3-polyprenylbenzoate decarboxylase